MSNYYYVSPTVTPESTGESSIAPLPVGEALVAGMFVYVHTNGYVYKTNLSSPRALGVVLETTDAGDMASVRFYGIATNLFTGLVPGQYYLQGDNGVYTNDVGNGTYTVMYSITSTSAIILGAASGLPELITINDNDELTLT